MRNFLKLGDVNVFELVHAVQRQPELWNQNTLRTTHPDTPHKQVDDIWLRFNDLEPYKKDEQHGGLGLEGIIDEHESIFYPAWFKLPQAALLVFNLMRGVEGVRLGRVLITRMAPGTCIAPHVDGGKHAEYYDRYHITLQNNPGSVFRCGNEEVQMKPGEIWWFDNSKLHEVVNNSVDDRLTMIVDIRTVR